MILLAAKFFKNFNQKYSEIKKNYKYNINFKDNFKY